MKTLKLTALLAGLAAFSITGTGLAQQQDGHMNHNMGGMAAKKEVQVKAVIHKADANSGILNVTHDPIPALKWPTMTMDLPATKRVDLSGIKEGIKALITLKQGRDKQFRIIAIKPAE